VLADEDALADGLDDLETGLDVLGGLLCHGMLSRLDVEGDCRGRWRHVERLRGRGFSGGAGCCDPRSVSTPCTGWALGFVAGVVGGGVGGWVGGVGGGGGGVWGGGGGVRRPGSAAGGGGGGSWGGGGGAAPPPRPPPPPPPGRPGAARLTLGGPPASPRGER